VHQKEASIHHIPPIKCSQNQYKRIVKIFQKYHKIHATTTTTLPRHTHLPSPWTPCFVLNIFPQHPTRPERLRRRAQPRRCCPRNPHQQPTSGTIQPVKTRRNLANFNYCLLLHELRDSHHPNDNMFILQYKHMHYVLVTMG
jgi:hypothetical protein